MTLSPQLLAVLVCPRCKGALEHREQEAALVCPSCRHESDIFGRGGGERTAEAMGVPFLGRIPIYEPIRRGGDAGLPLVVEEPDSPAALAFFSVAERAAAQVSIARYRNPIIPLPPMS